MSVFNPFSTNTRKHARQHKMSLMLTESLSLLPTVLTANQKSLTFLKLISFCGKSLYGVVTLSVSVVNLLMASCAASNSHFPFNLHWKSLHQSVRGSKCASAELKKHYAQVFLRNSDVHFSTFP